MQVQKVVRVCEKILVKVKGPLGNVLWACGQLATAATRCPQVYHSGMLPETVQETERLTIQNTNQPLFDKLLRDEAEFAAARGKRHDSDIDSRGSWLVVVDMVNVAIRSFWWYVAGGGKRWLGPG